MVTEQQVITQAEAFLQQFLDYAADKIEPGHGNVKIPEVLLGLPIPNKEYDLLLESLIDIKEIESFIKKFMPEQSTAQYDLHFNVITINREKISPAIDLHLSHESFHYLRKIFQPDEKCHSGYNDIQSLNIESLFNLDLVPADVAEFFGNLGPLVMHWAGNYNHQNGLGVNLEKYDQNIAQSKQPIDVMTEIPEIGISIMDKAFHLAKSRLNGGDCTESEQYDQDIKMLNTKYASAGKYLCWFEKKGVIAQGTFKHYKQILGRIKSVLHDFDVAEYEGDIRMANFNRGVVESAIDTYLKTVKFMDKMPGTNHISPYMRSRVAIKQNYDNLKQNWTEVMKMSWKDVDKEYFAEVSRPDNAHNIFKEL
ncbi:hypothetical protein ACFL96_19545 [Thermoproteota archaeon]